MTDWQACSCEDCVAMCKNRPCWPSPEEAKKLIELGYGDRLALDYWVGEGDDGLGELGETIHIVSPAIVGREGRNAPFWPTGRCTFLTDDNKCELHDICKPMEGRLQIHENSTEQARGIHRDVASLWDTQEGRSVVHLWEWRDEYA